MLRHFGQDGPAKGFDSSNGAPDQLTEQNTVISPRTCEFGQRLATWLNDSKGTSAHRRVGDMIELVGTVRKGLTRYQRISAVAGDRKFSGEIPIEVSSGDPEYERKMLRLNRKLRRYRFFPCLNFPLRRGWLGTWEPAGKGAHRRRFRLSEHDAVQWLFELLMDQHLDRLRSCGCGCGSWFFAKRPDQRFYGSHRQMRYRTSPEFKKERAQYMREYRRKDKERNEQARKVVRRVLGRDDNR